MLRPTDVLNLSVLLCPFSLILPAEPLFLRTSEIPDFMRFTYYGQSCFAVEAGGKNLVFDPFITPNDLARHV